MNETVDNWEEDGAARWSPEVAEAAGSSDPALESEAMSEVDAALEPLDDAARTRVLRWALERYGVGEASGG
jgi:hypothetical protein